MGNLYRYFVKKIASARKINEEELTNIINELKIRTPQHALDYKIIDGIKYADEVEMEIKKMNGLEVSEELNTISLKAFIKVPNPNTSVSDNKIAVLYLNGEIMGGNGGEETIGSDKIAKTIKEIRTKGKYKAIVLRINSPGGSALASDVIWREVILAKEKMPVVVSMGTVAASGGYYIAAPADKIFALPNTLTGSIGVFGMLINAQKLLKDKIGVNIETVKFGKYADLGSPERPLTPDEEAIIQNEIDKVYDDFISKVSKGRKLTKQQVDDLAQGRVYSGIEAKQLGLIDEFGGLDDAIKFAAEKAGLTDYRTVNLPELNDPLDEFIGMLSSSAQAWFLKSQIGAENAEIINKTKKIQHLQGIQMLMPYQISIH
jgi:protease-4